MLIGQLNVKDLKDILKGYEDHEMVTINITQTFSNGRAKLHVTGKVYTHITNRENEVILNFE